MREETHTKEEMKTILNNLQDLNRSAANGNTLDPVVMLPCPFCGGNAEHGQIAKNHHGVRCSVCQIGTRMITKDEAIKRWNTRQHNA